MTDMIKTKKPAGKSGKTRIVLVILALLVLAGFGLSFTTPNLEDFENAVPDSFKELEAVRATVPTYHNYGFISDYVMTKKVSSVSAERISMLGFAGQIIRTDGSTLLTFTVNCLNWFPNLIRGAGTTVALTLVSVLVGIFLSVFLALGKMSQIPIVRPFCRAYIFFFRGTPLLMQLFFVWFGLPLINPALTLQSKFTAACIAFSLNCGAYCAEYVRAAIESIDKGQFEAARALGFGYGRTMFKIIIPQTYKRVIPSFANEFIMVLKDASLTSIIAMEDLSKATQNILTSTNQVSVYIPAMALYLLMTWACTKLFGALEEKFSIYQ